MLNDDNKKIFVSIEGKKIIRFHVLGVNCVGFEVEDGKCFVIETVCVQPSLGIYGMEITECTKKDLIGGE